MKTNVFIVLASAVLFLGNNARAQYSDMYYHRVGDTIEWRAPNGYYSWWEWEAFYENNIAMDPNWFCASGAGEWRMTWSDSLTTVQRFYTPVPLKIIGIAGSGVRVRQPATLDTGVTGEYYMIYDAAPDGMTLLKQVPWKTTDPHRTLHVKMHCVAPGFGAETPDSCCWYHPGDVYFPIYEYYFDSAIYVTDSFYVGGTLWNISHLYNPDDQGNSYASGYNHGYMFPYNGLCNYELLTPFSGNHCLPAGVTVKCKSSFYAGYSYGTYADAPWVWRQPSAVSLIYPIVEVDTTVPPEGSCIEVGNVAVVHSGTSATVTWDNFPNYTSVILRYGPCNLPQSQWTTANVTGATLHTIEGLAPSTCYGVSMKAVCDKQEMPWSPAIQFYSGSDTSAHDESVTQTTVLSAQTFLQPIPASDKLAVSSSFNLGRIEIRDLAGVLVYSEPATGHMETIDIGFLRSGTYIVTVFTHLGTTNKKLIVQR